MCLCALSHRGVPLSRPNEAPVIRDRFDALLRRRRSYLLLGMLLAATTSGFAAAAAATDATLPVATPEGITLDTVTLETSRYEIHGTAPSLSRVAGFVSDLERSTALDAVELRESRVEGSGTDAKIRFVITARDAGPH